MRTLVPGERAEVGDELTLTLALDAPLRPPLALALIGLDRARRPPSDFPPVDTVRRELRPGVAFDDSGALQLKLADLPASVDRLALAAFLTTGPGGGSAFRALQRIELRAANLRFPLDLVDRSDTAIVLAEIYRHAGGWRLAANGQGFVQGLPAFAEVYGADLEWARRLGGRPDPSSADDGRRPAGPPSGSASGSGVAVDAHHVLTNAHVVEDARSVRVAGDGRPAEADIVFADPHNDLALVRVAEPLSSFARFRDTIELHLGEEVVALGFPLHGLLGSGPQASAGNIAALSGVGNDTSVFQFTAPIASGNSGGPILDPAGLLVGLVSSSLNIDRVRASGSNAENVNFGIKGATIRSFLDAYGIVPTLDATGVPAPRAAMVRTARASLHRIVCTC